MKNCLLALCILMSALCRAQVDTVECHSCAVMHLPRHYLIGEVSTGGILMISRLADPSAGKRYAYQPGGSASATIGFTARRFTMLTGLSFDYTILRQYGYYSSDGATQSTISQGYRIRLGAPLLWRWYCAPKAQAFFQFGLAVGGDMYRGWGASYEDRGRATAPGVVNGWLRSATAYVDPFIVGVGYRPYLHSLNSILISANASPGGYQFGHGGYQPWMQLSVGVSLYKPLH